MELKVSYIQTELFWENKQKNLEMFSEKIASIEEETDIIILPEMFTTGFSMDPDYFAEEMSGNSVEWMQKEAKKKNVLLIGSLIIKDDFKYYNRLLAVFPDGNILQYDKRHLFTLAGEHRVYSGGNDRLVFDYKGWRICPLICYDLRFPVWSRNTENYDVLIFIANWPERRNFAWKQLLIARAIENMCYTIGVNRVGLDGNKINHSGDSAVLDYFGNNLIEENSNKEEIKTITLQKDPMKKARNKLQFLNDQDNFTV
ncbi:amidohydrolase [Aureivirga sp. CE67]|uniref:amidohydrolase n=1 Tax=Aureivirga sp. CE67 TaxID=1788983 RepID=UPI0018C96A98|nr:amidohydrolase [Aureivirga sp. CE67]